jgi:hypothetical protein
MIFTRRFGALAARPVFPDVVETDVEQEVELAFDPFDGTHDADESAA